MTDISGNNPGLMLSNAVAAAVERGGQATVLVNARRRLPLSGVLFAPDLLVTASHGIEREEDIQVIFADGSQQAATLAGRDRGTDLAVLRLPNPGKAQAARPSEQEPRVGSLVVALGRPDPSGIQASLGMITALGSGLRTAGGGLIDRYLVTDTVPYPGFSGGPLIDLAGDVLGINTSGLVRGSSLAIPVKMVWSLAQNLAQHGHIRRGFLGIRSQVVEIPSQARSALGRDQSTGLLLVGVEPEGPGASALMVGDILVGLDGQPVADHDDLMARLSADTVGKQVSVQVLRGGQLQTVPVKIGEKE